MCFFEGSAASPRSANRPGLESVQGPACSDFRTVHVSPSLLLRLFQRRRRPFLSHFSISPALAKIPGVRLLPPPWSNAAHFPGSIPPRKADCFPPIPPSSAPGQRPLADNRRHSTPRKYFHRARFLCRHHLSEPCRSFGKAVQAAQQVVHRHLEYLSHQFQRVRVGNRLTIFPAGNSLPSDRQFFNQFIL